MQNGGNNFKDIKDNSLSLKDNALSISYPKINKLITALYMVTDIIEKEEPIRLRLRTLGVEILSDITFLSQLHLNKKVQEILSLLDIVSAIQMISEMNASILKKEFFQLSGSIEEYQKSNLFGGNSTLTDFFKEEEDSVDSFNENKNYSIGHPTRIGVQKGSTLLKALSDKMLTRPIGGFTRPIERSKLSESMPVLNTQNLKKNREVEFDLLKKQRRYEIVKIIKNLGTEGASITDIKNKIKEISSPDSSLISCSEKTLQRELVAMVTDDVLKKVGTKRWSKYSIKN